MGELVNRGVTTAVAAAAAVVIIGLNAVLLWNTVT
jgi:Mn2+/Fe2+ NRAMP family transporter